MITQKLLKELLEYDQNTGVFKWKKRSARRFKSERSCMSWNTRYSNKIAGCRSGGYFQISIFKKRIRTHVAAWIYINGSYPDGEIDHIDGDGKNNSISNLRDVSSAENSRNMATPVSNTSGRVGVSYRKDKLKFRAFSSKNNKSVHIGYFDTIIDAVAERIRYEKDNNFHKNHGRINHAA